MNIFKVNLLKGSVIVGLMALLSFSLVSGNVSNWSEADLAGQKIQEWANKNDDILIQFTYEPEKPIIDTFTELKFSVQKMSTGEHIQNLTGRVVVTNGQRLFKFENISIPDGHFSVKYLFPDDGTHQVLLRLDGDKGLTELASFNVFVPHQSPPSLLDPFVQQDKVYLTIIITAILSAVTIITIIFLKKAK